MKIGAYLATAAALTMAAVPGVSSAAQASSAAKLSVLGSPAAKSIRAGAVNAKQSKLAPLLILLVVAAVAAGVVVATDDEDNSASAS